MSELLIFGGTTEGRLLAEYCSDNNIVADVSVATDYGASLLPDNVRVFCGKINAEQMKALILADKYRFVVDATHPYAVEATKNINSACSAANVQLLRLIRKSSVSCGKTVKTMDELICFLDRTEGNILSTLGSKSLAELARIRDFRERIWVRVLPSDTLLEQCRKLGYDTSKVIQEKGPFTFEQNISHLKISHASVLVTKESGETGGYSEKAKAAMIFGAELVTLTRPPEQGLSFEEITEIIRKELKK